MCIRTRNWPPRALQTQKHRQIRRLRNPNPMEDIPDQDSAKNVQRNWNCIFRFRAIVGITCLSSIFTKLRAGTRVTQIQWNDSIWIELCFGCVFRKCVLPGGLAKEPPEMLKISKRLDSIDFMMVVTTPTCKFDAKITPDAFKHVPDLFWRAPG